MEENNRLNENIKKKDAAKQYGEGKPFIIWAQDQKFKLYSHGKFIAVDDRHETNNIAVGKGAPIAEAARAKLQAAINSMPKTNKNMMPK